MLCFWVEGDTDKYFLLYYLKEQLKVSKNYQIETLGGFGGIVNKNPKFEEYRFKGYELVFLLDGDVKDRKEIKSSFEAIKSDKENKPDKVFYIEPDLETLLLETKSSDTCIDCFKTYEECIDKELTSKSRFYAYLDALGKQHKAKDCWEIFDFSNSAFNDLETFLKKCFE